MLVPNKTSFAWYTELAGQNRYKSQCEAACNYRHIMPTDRVPPFQIYTGREWSSITLVSWKIWCAEDNTLLEDLTSTYMVAWMGGVVGTATAGGFLQYDGPTMYASGFRLNCGSYYMTVETDLTTYYSEVFEVVEFTDNSLSSVSLIPLFTPWKFHDSQEKLDINSSQCAAQCAYKLITPNDEIPPFQFIIPHTTDAVNSFVMEDENGLCVIEVDISLITKTQVGDVDYITFNGGDGLELPCGTFYAIVTVGDDSYYGEGVFVLNTSFTPVSADYLQTDSGIALTNDDGVQLTID